MSHVLKDALDESRLRGRGRPRIKDHDSFEECVVKKRGRKSKEELMRLEEIKKTKIKEEEDKIRIEEERLKLQ